MQADVFVSHDDSHSRRGAICGDGNFPISCPRNKGQMLSASTHLKYLELTGSETGAKAGQSRWEGSCCFLMGKVWKLAALGTVAQCSECNESHCCCSLRNGSNGAWDTAEIFFLSQ